MRKGYVLNPYIKIVIDSKYDRYLRYFDSEYKKISSHELNLKHATIYVYIVNKLPKKLEGDRHRNINFKNFLTHNFLIRGLETDKVEIFFQEKIVGRLYNKLVTLFLQAQVLEPIIYYKLLEKNVLFLHAAGVSDGENGYIFPAYGGTGKTTLALGLISEGMFFLGDDLLLVEAEKMIVHPYMRPLHLFTYNINSLRNAVIPQKLRLKLLMKDMIRYFLERITKQEFLISTRIHAEDLYENFPVGSSVKIKKIIFLKKSGNHERIEVTKENIEELARFILESQDLNKSLYDNVLTINEKNKIMNRELEITSMIMSNLKYFEIVNIRIINDKSVFLKALTSNHFFSASSHT